jgi:hypothetical protein
MRENSDYQNILNALAGGEGLKNDPQDQRSISVHAGRVHFSFDQGGNLTQLRIADAQNTFRGHLTFTVRRAKENLNV